METTWLITVAGNDDPELLQQFTRAIALCEGRLLDQQLVSIAGRLSGLYRIQLPQAHLDWAWQRLDTFASSGLHVIARERLNALPSTDAQVSLSISGPYRLGLDQDIRMILESHGADIEQYNQHAVGGSILGRADFQARIQARVTRELCEERLQQTLQRLSPGLSIDIQSRRSLAACRL